MTKVKKTVYLSLIISQALVLHYIESFIPSLAPGAKLGLANIMTLVTIILYGFKESLAVVAVRSVLGPLLGGSPTSIMYSMAGGFLSCLIMNILYRFNKYFSLMGISVAGAVFHNIGQLIVASVIFNNIGVLFTYMPVLMLSSVLTGNFIGLMCNYLSKFLSLRLRSTL